MLLALSTGTSTNVSVEAKIQTVRNQGVHYAHTIEMWYHNLVKNKDAVIK